jgi:hypothetical protein
LDALCLRVKVNRCACGVGILRFLLLNNPLTQSLTKSESKTKQEESLYHLQTSICRHPALSPEQDTSEV